MCRIEGRGGILRHISHARAADAPSLGFALRRQIDTVEDDPSAGYPETRAFPANGFYPGPIPHQGAHPVVPSSPEPSTLLLLGAGTAALAAQRRGRGRAEAQSQA